MTPYTLPSFQKNKCSPSQTFPKHPLFTTFSLFLTVDEVCYNPNKCWLPNISANKIFLHNTPYTPPLYQKKFTFSIEESLRNTLFPTVFTVDEVCYISNKCWLPNKSANTLHSSSIFKKFLHLPWQNLLETSTFSTFLLVLTVDEVCYISNKYQPTNKLLKYQYFYPRNFKPFFQFNKEIACFIAEAFRNIHFLPPFHYF